MGTALTVKPPALPKLSASAWFESVASAISTERFELGLSDGPSCSRPRASEPKAPRPSRPCRSTGSALTGAQFSFVWIRGPPVRPGGHSPPAKCRGGGEHGRAGGRAGPTSAVCILQCPCGVFPPALHRRACRHGTSRRGLRRLVGCDPSVECIYTTVDVAAVQLNLYPWTHGTSRLRSDGLRERI